MAISAETVAITAALSEVRTICLEIEAEAVVMLDGQGRTFDGDTKKSITSDVRFEGSDIIGVVGAGSAHALVVHEGRRPLKKRPPTAPIERWVQKKLGVSKEESRGVAYIIAKRIGERGIPGTPFLTEPLERKRADIVPRVARRVAAALNGQV